VTIASFPSASRLVCRIRGGEKRGRRSCLPELQEKDFFTLHWCSLFAFGEGKRGEGAYGGRRKKKEDGAVWFILSCINGLASNKREGKKEGRWSSSQGYKKKEGGWEEKGIFRHTLFLSTTNFSNKKKKGKGGSLTECQVQERKKLSARGIFVLSSIQFSIPPRKAGRGNARSLLPFLQLCVKGA